MKQQKYIWEKRGKFPKHAFRSRHSLGIALAAHRISSAQKYRKYGSFRELEKTPRQSLKISTSYPAPITRRLCVTLVKIAPPRSATHEILVTLFKIGPSRLRRRQTGRRPPAASTYILRFPAQFPLPLHTPT